MELHKNGVNILLTPSATKYINSKDHLNEDDGNEVHGSDWSGQHTRSKFQGDLKTLQYSEGKKENPR